jgi:hypothetical protein
MIATINPDLQKFIDKFEPSKYKLVKTGLEVRGVRDMPRNLSQAKELIDRLQLNLTVSHNAEMLTYGGFEVLPIKV